MDIQTVINRL